MKSWQIILILVFAVGLIAGFCCSRFNIFPSRLPAYPEVQSKLARELGKLPAPSKRFVLVAKLVTPAVVHVTTRGERRVHDPFADFFREFSPRRRGGMMPVTSFGSGVIVDTKGHVITNHHVVQYAREVTVKLGDGRQFEAAVLGSDPQTDLAILKISGSNLPTAELGNSDKIEVGEWVLAIGNPFGLEQTVTSGIISAKGRSNVGIAELEDFIQTDAAVNPGNSGGPLVGMNGKVIGITSAIASNTGGYQGIGFAIPASMVRVVMKGILKQGKVLRGWLGVYITDMTQELAKELGITYRRGVYVEEVVPDSPAAKAGLKEGDVVTKANGEKLTSATQLRNVIAATEIGKELRLSYCRGDKEGQCSATIVTPDPGSEFKGLETETGLGMTVANLTRAVASRYGYEEGEGVLVVKVEKGGLADQAGIQPREVIVGINSFQVTDVKAFRRLSSRVRPGRSVTIHVKNGDTLRVLMIR
jgi:serine protease Do